MVGYTARAAYCFCESYRNGASRETAGKLCQSWQGFASGWVCERPMESTGKCDSHDKDLCEGSPPPTPEEAAAAAHVTHAPRTPRLPACACYMYRNGASSSMETLCRRRESYMCETCYLCEPVVGNAFNSGRERVRSSARCDTGAEGRRRWKKAESKDRA